jgi:SNF2 family DNA or RNA helicase
MEPVGSCPTPCTKLDDALMPFQREGVRFGIERCKGRVMVADEMGLGKTIQAIAIAKHYQDQWPLLIVCPSSMKHTWASELEKWLPFVPCGEINLLRGRNDVDNLSKLITIATYPLFVKDAPVVAAIARKRYRVCICDESHYLKNRKSMRATILLPIVQRAKHLVLLSGTPALARPAELFSQLSALRRDVFPDFTSFARQFCDARQVVALHPFYYYNLA